MCIVDDSSLKRLYINSYNYDKKSNDYNFLDGLKKYKNVSNIYLILDNIDKQTIKNIYNYIFLKWKKINNLESFKYARTIDNIEFNDEMNEFINNELYKSIYVLNSIIVYLMH